MLFNFSNSELAYFCLFLVAFTFLVTQALTKQKQLAHILFAVFCASLCMMTIQKMTASSIGIYQYIIGFAACATCNATWLISRALFRGENAVTKRHILVAAFIALLIITNQAWYLIGNLNPNFADSALMVQLKQGVMEVSNLLSSTILLLSFWEALRGFSTKSKAEKLQRIIFAGAFFTAVFSSTFIAKALIAPDNQMAAFPWIVFASASLIIIAIQLVLTLQKQYRNSHLTSNNDNQLSLESTHSKSHLDKQHTSSAKSAQSNKLMSAEDNALIMQINKLIQSDKIYLQANIKLLDFAKATNAPEYRVSRLIRSHFNSPNFNHFINHYRVEHAKNLLTSTETNSWSILVIGLESGFTSLVSFNRAFKNLSGKKPSAYRVSAPNNESCI